MPITRNGPVLNMDTEQPLVFSDPKKRFTRCQASRLLKYHEIKHDPSLPLNELMMIISMNNITPAFVPPGKMKTDEPKIIEFPNNVPKLRKMCKNLGIQYKMTDKKVDLIRKLQEHG